MGKVSFHTNDHVWTFSRKYKGRKFCHGTKQLCGTPGIAQKRKSSSLRRITGDQGPRTRAVERGHLDHGAEVGIDGDWE